MTTGLLFLVVMSATPQLGEKLMFLAFKQPMQNPPVLSLQSLDLAAPNATTADGGGADEPAVETEIEVGWLRDPEDARPDAAAELGYYVSPAA